MKMCHFIIRDKISLGRPCTDDDLKALDCYYESPVFPWDGSSTSLDNIFDNISPHFRHFIDLSAELIIEE